MGSIPCLPPATDTPGSSTRAVFLDVLGTLLALDPPWLTLRHHVPKEVSDERLREAIRAEMAYYRAHAQEGRDPKSLADLRRRCAELLSRELGVEVDAETLVSSIRFSPYPDVDPALRELGDRGLRLVAVSNWDCSLPEVLQRCGLAQALDGTVTSADARAAKPDPAIFEKALRLAGCAPAEVLHVGDTPGEDVDGARAAGIRPLLIDRDGGAGDIASLEDVTAHL